MDTVKLSKGNSKIGNIWNISLPPGGPACKGAPCKKQCYAQKAWKMYPDVRKAWTSNWNLWKRNPALYMRSILEHCRTKRCKYFRWHVAGDIPSTQYLMGMLAIAEACPNTSFLCFTKRLDLLTAGLPVPANLRFIVSAWPGSPARDSMFQDLLSRGSRAQVAWLHPDTPQSWDINAKSQSRYRRLFDRYAGTGTPVCPGSCEGCMTCWDNDSDVVFHAH